MKLTMPVNTDDGWATLECFSVDPELIKTAKAYAITIKHNLGSLTVVTNGGIGSSVSIKATTLMLAKQNKLGPASKMEIQIQLEHSLQYILAEAEKEGVTLSEPAPSTNNTKSGTNGTNDDDDEEDSEEGISLKSTKPKLMLTPEKNTIPVINSIKAHFPIDLKDADVCYTPVHGTSSGSVYHVVAILTGLKMAARYKLSVLSLRCVVTKLSNYDEDLLNLGFSKHDDYYSVHYKIDSHKLGLKTLGAVLSSLGVGSIIQVADFHKFLEVQ